MSCRQTGVLSLSLVVLAGLSLSPAQARAAGSADEVLQKAGKEE